MIMPESHAKFATVHKALQVGDGRCSLRAAVRDLYSPKKKMPDGIGHPAF